MHVGCSSWKAQWCKAQPALPRGIKEISHVQSFANHPLFFSFSKARPSRECGGQTRAQQPSKIGSVMAKPLIVAWPWVFPTEVLPAVSASHPGPVATCEWCCSAWDERERGSLWPGTSYKKLFRDKKDVYLLPRQPGPCCSPLSCCFSLPLHLSCNSHSAYKWLCSLSLLCVFIHGPYLLSIHMFYIKLANEM